MSIWRTEVTPELLERLSRGTFADRIGIRITEVGPDYLRATMPVTPEVHQPYGVLHGGASVALAETVGSVAANLCIDRERLECFGQEINANHLRSIASGVVTATARPYHIGSRSHVWGIEIRDEQRQTGLRLASDDGGRAAPGVGMMSAPATRVWIAGIAALLACSGCGFKGPLYLPERNATVVTHPAQTPAKNKGKTSQPSQPSSSPPRICPGELAAHASTITAHFCQ